ncbi:helix-turn-helix domain-containing protein [Maribacter aurantiacus]|uniref:Helix-turn-helix domain-containing protein n=1 Tax=Maribacter aurantiacus TaxID=1882343 RepID=A0A5R8M6V2_9FLAO|nr:helix-turn-helix domain-containing protein [Maribacter aurantiacus]TLF45276.1 helix-turn-helix domain-containing protein [Maribacter aurantiacus]
MDSLETKKYIDLFISQSINENNSDDLFDGYHALASYYYQHNDTLKLIESTDKLFAVAKTNNLKIPLLKAYHLKNNYLKMKFGMEDPRIFKNIYEALEISKEIKSTVWESKYYDDIAGFYKLTGDFNQALEYYKKNLSILKEIANSEDYKEFKIWGGSLEKTCLELSEIHIDLKEIDSARAYNQMAKKILDSTDSDNFGVLKYRNIINNLEINFLENDIISARKNLRKAIEFIPKSFNEPFQKYSKLYYSGLVSYHEGDFKKAVEKFESIDTTRININQRAGFYYGDLYKFLYKSHLNEGNLKKSDFYFEKHLEALNRQMNVNNSVNSNFRITEIAQYDEEVEKLLNQKSRQRFYLIMMFVGSFFTISIVIYYYKKKQKANKEKLKILVDRVNDKNTKTKTTSLKINSDEISRIIERLNEFENKEYFLNIDCTASNTAKKLKTNTTYLSKIINVHYGKSFSDYINDLRIDYVINKFQNDIKFRKYSIQGIANEIGFKSKESFNSAFKKRMGVLPSALIKELQKEPN